VLRVLVPDGTLLAQKVMIFSQRHVLFLDRILPHGCNFLLLLLLCAGCPPACRPLLGFLHKRFALIRFSAYITGNSDGLQKNATARLFTKVNSNIGKV
jgi:hypothetical protein